MDYFNNEIDAFPQGCRLDARVRFAMDLMKRSPIYSSKARPEQDDPLKEFPDPRALATHALAVAAALFDLGEDKGLIRALPDHGELSAELRLQAKRTAKFSVAQQVAAQKETREQAGAVAVPFKVN